VKLPWLLALLMLAVPMVAVAAESRPRVGLVLSGGGARGAAHVGVLKVLEGMRVPIDAIAGTSMGAVVGGLYASGMSAAEIEATLGAVDWEEVLGDRPPRDDLSFRRKEEDRNFLVRLPLGLHGGEFRLPKGLVQGQRLNELLRRLTLPVATVKDFDALPTRFRAVATDLESGDRVVLRSGDLTTAMRASMSVPGVFVPVESQGRLLVDGGLADNLPVDVARAMGVDVLIVVDTGFPLLTRDRLSTVPIISNQMIAILVRRNSEIQRAGVSASDVLIDPALGSASSFDFRRFTTLIDAGGAAAQAVAPRLARLALREPQYTAWLAARAQARGGAAPRIEFVQVAPGSERYQRPIDDLFGGFVGQPLDGAAVGAQVTALYGLGNLETLDYQVVEDSGGRDGLEVTAKRNSWGPNYVRFGLGLGDDFEGNSAYNATARFVLAEMNRLGGEWTWDLQVGESPRVATEVYLPFSYRSRWFALPQAKYEARNVPLFDGSGRRLAEYRVKGTRFGLDFGREFGSAFEIRAGVHREDGESRVRLGDPTLPSGEFDVRQYYARFAYDGLDDVGFPRRGASFFLEWTGEHDLTEQGVDSNLLTLDWQIARSRGRNRGVLSASLGTNLDGGPGNVRNLYPLGGFLNLSGLAPGEIAGRHFAIARAIYYRQIGRAGTGILDLPTYVGVAYEVGNVWDERRDIGFDSARNDFSVFFGVNSWLGPLYLGAGYDDSGDMAYFLSLGRSF
jgi:NTE family protein